MLKFLLCVKVAMEQHTEALSCSIHCSSSTTGRAFTPALPSSPFCTTWPSVKSWRTRIRFHCFSDTLFWIGTKWQRIVWRSITMHFAIAAACSKKNIYICNFASLKDNNKIVAKYYIEKIWKFWLNFIYSTSKFCLRHLYPPITSRPWRP